MAKAFKINVEERKVESITINSLDDIKKAIGDNCKQLVCPASFGNGDMFILDYDGEVNNYNGGFIVEGLKEPLIGNSILLHLSGESKFEDVKKTKRELVLMLEWFNQEELKKYFESI